MTSVTVKKPCVKCSKGTGVTTCDGCQQSYCVKHFVEHRQELSHQMEDICQEHDLLRRDLDQDNGENSLLARINTWEQESISKIQVAAEAARANLHELLVRNKEELRKSVTKITGELQACRELDDYTEIDINKWTEQLQKLRKMLESPSTINTDEGKTSKSIIRLIRVRGQQQNLLPNSTIGGSNCCSNERFNGFIGKILISQDGLAAICDVNLFSRAIVYGVNRYSSGTHQIHFLINEIGNLDPFFEIISAAEKSKNHFVSQNSNYGWWDMCRVVTNCRIHLCDSDKVVRTDDEMMLTINCDNRQIQLQHHRTNRTRQLNISLDQCPFPWKVVVELQSVGDSVRIL